MTEALQTPIIRSEARTSPPVISLCLAGNGEAAIVYTSPKGKRTEVGRGVWDRQTVDLCGGLVSEVMNSWRQGRSDSYTAGAKAFWDVLAGRNWHVCTSRQLAKVLEQGEP